MPRAMYPPPLFAAGCPGSYAEGNRTQSGFLGQLAANAAQNTLKISTDIPCGILLALTASCSVKTAKHL